MLGILEVLKEPSSPCKNEGHTIRATAQKIIAKKAMPVEGMNSKGRSKPVEWPSHLPKPPPPKRLL